MKRREAARLHERDEKVLRRRFRDHIEVERHPRVAVRRESHAADHRRAEAVRSEKFVRVTPPRNPRAERGTPPPRIGMR
jgi:hypothetical protein